MECLLDTKTIRFIKLQEVPKGRKVAYIRIIINIREQKTVRKHFQLTMG